MAFKLKKGITKSPLKLTQKQKTMPGSVPAPKFKPRDRKAGNKYTARKSNKA